MKKTGSSPKNVRAPEAAQEYARQPGLKKPDGFYQEAAMCQPGAQISREVSSTADPAGLHSHAFFEILFVCRGHVQYLVNSSRYQLQPGDIVLIPPGTPHRPLLPETAGEPYERFVLWIDPSFCESQLRLFPELGFAAEQCGRAGSCLLRSPEPTYTGYYEDFCQLWAEQEKRRFGWQAAVAFGAVSLLLHIGRTYYYRSAVACGAEEHSLFDDMLLYVDNHIGEKLSLEGMAEHFHVSRSTVSHLFLRQLGVSFYRCVIHRRLITAKNDILRGDALRDVWEPCGFADYTSFYRLFRKEYGLSPTEFRRGNAALPAQAAGRGRERQLHPARPAVPEEHS